MAIGVANRGEFLLLVLPTGMGKSLCFQVNTQHAIRNQIGSSWSERLCFQLPAMFEPGATTVVVSPLRGLMAQQVARLQPGLLTQGVPGVPQDPLASRLHSIPTHNLHRI